MKTIKLNSRHVRVGDTLKWDIVDDGGRLLLKKGAVITSGRQCLLLLERGFALIAGEEVAPAKAAAVDGAASNPFDIIEQSAFRLSQVFYKLIQQEDVKAAADAVVQSIIAACKKDSDATLGAVHLLHGHAYTTIHPIHTAVLCHSLCEALQSNEADTHNAMLAALTSNIGMLELQEELHHQTEPLSEAQLRQIQQHPEASVKILRASGLNDDGLLETVLQHHERSHGEGYPRGLKGEQIAQGAKILALADVYSAMISPRSYRESMQASHALKTLFLERGKEYDETLAVLLIKHMGVYPPGSFVQLANGEIAVVVRRSHDKMTPKVASVVSNKGMPFSRPVFRNTGEAAFNVKGMVSPKHQINLSLSNLWGYG